MTLDASLDFLDVSITPGKDPQSLGIRPIDSDRSILNELADRIHIHILNDFGVPIVYALLDRFEPATNIV